MKVTDLFEKKNVGQLILTILFIIYLVTGNKMTKSFAYLIDTPLSKIIIIVIAIILFVSCNPILSILGIVVAYEMIIKAEQITGSTFMNAPEIDNEKWVEVDLYKYEYSLEQEITYKMKPGVQVSTFNDKAKYKPLLNDTSNAKLIYII